MFPDAALLQNSGKEGLGWAAFFKEKKKVLKLLFLKTEQQTLQNSKCYQNNNK